MLPETYLSANLACFRGKDLSSFPKVIFNQNGYYTFSGVSDNLERSLNLFYDDPSVLHVLSISEDTHSLLRQNLAIPDHKLSRIVNAVEPIFSPLEHKENRFHWMPRKNPDDVQAVLLGVKRAQLKYSGGWIGQPLQDMSHKQISQHLNTSRLFLAFGHPEGFGLPIAEAMASGCWVVGYSGGGGSELFSFGASEEVAFGDWSGFVIAIQRALSFFAKEPRETELRLQRQSLAVRTLYSISEERSSIQSAWDEIYQSFHFFCASN